TVRFPAGNRPCDWIKSCRIRSNPGIFLALSGMSVSGGYLPTFSERRRARVVSAFGAAMAVALLNGATPSGPKVGEAVPDFRLSNQDGNKKTLGSVLGPKGALLVFYRSADW